MINYDFPTNTEDYIHQIGRTGRAGRKGVAITFFTSENSKSARDLVGILREANQEVPPELQDMVRYSGGGGGGGGEAGHGRSPLVDQKGWRSGSARQTRQLSKIERTALRIAPPTSP